MGKVLGYARISSDIGQDVASQKTALEKLGAIVVFTETGNGSSLDGRDQLEAASLHLRSEAERQALLQALLNGRNEPPLAPHGASSLILIVAKGSVRCLPFGMRMSCFGIERAVLLAHDLAIRKGRSGRCGC